MGKHRTGTYSLRSLFLAVLACALVALVIRNVIGWKKGAERQAFIYQLSSIWAGLDSYNDGSAPGLPNASPRDRRGRPLYSWRVAILPHIMSMPGRLSPRQPWNSPQNTAFAAGAFGIYSYGSPDPRPGGTFPPTNVFAVTGTGTAFGDGIEKPILLSDMPDDTIVLLEIKESGVPWPHW